MEKAIAFMLVSCLLAIAIPMSGQDHFPLKNNRDTIIVHQGWPISKPGKNERGGIYCNLDQDDDLEIIYTVGNWVYAFNKNGTEVPGWPVELNYPTDGVAAFGDIDGDGQGEVVVTTHQPTSYNDGRIYAFRMDGVNVTGFPVTTVGGPLRSPVLADINQDGKKEIIVAIRDWPEGFIAVYMGNGTQLDGWPQRLDYIPASEVAVGDITGDQVPEIIAESYYSLNVFTAEGPMLAGFPFTPGNNRVFSYSSPVLADIDDDGLREIIFGDHSTSAIDGKVYILRNDGTHFPNWPKDTGCGIYAPPAVGDVDGNGYLDVTVGEYGFGTQVYKLYAWDALSGQELTGFPVSGLNSVNNQIIIADLDGDEQVELMFDDNTSAGVYPGYNHDGTPMDGWPLTVEGSTFYINPFVADLDGDGIIEISGGGYDPDDDLTYLYLWQTEVAMNEELALLPIFQYNTRHNGVVGDYLMVQVPEKPESMAPTLSGIMVSPNPVTSECKAETTFSSSGKAFMELYDLTGRRLISYHFRATANLASTVRIDVSGFENGLYLLKARLGNETLSGKILVNN